MLFKPEFIPLLKSGQKTQTRRLVKEGDKLVSEAWGVAHPDAVVTTSGHVRWMVDHTYAVQPGRGKKSVGRVLVTSIRRQRLDQMTMYDAIAEGADSSWNGADCLAWFRRVWNKICKVYGTRYQDNPDAWVLGLEWVR